MASKDLTFNLLARDAGAGAAMLKLAASMEALNREMKRVSGSGDDVDRSFKKTTASSEKTHHALSGLLTTAAALGPALLPVGVAAAGAFAGLGAAASVAALGVLGIRDAMKSGSALGLQYQAAFKPITAEFDHLKQLAAANMFTGINQAVKSSQALFPTLNRDVGVLSTQIGQIVSHVAPGLVALFERLNPLIVSLGSELVGGSAKFEQWAKSSGSVSKFVTQAQSLLPQVEHTLAAVATAAGHLLQGIGPLGGMSLSTIGVFARTINLIPVGVLQVAAPALAALVVALKAMQVAEKAQLWVTGLTTSLGGLTAAETGASVASAGLIGQLGGVAAAGVGLSIALDALQKHFGKGSWFDLSFLRGTWFKSGGGGGGTPPAAAGAAAIGAATTAMMGAQVKAGIVIDGVTNKLNAQSTAAGLLAAAFGRLNGTALSVEQTENTFLDTLGQLKSAHDAGTASIAQNNAAGRANPEVLVSAIQAAKQAAQATADQTAKTKGLNAGLSAGRTSLLQHEAAIRRAAAAAGLDAAQVNTLIGTLGRVPRNVVTAISVRDNATSQIAIIQANLAALKSKQIDITTYVRNVILPTLGSPSQTHDSRIRDTGGPVVKGEPYLIGLNRRPEIFIPGQSGRIVPIPRFAPSRAVVTPAGAGGLTADAIAQAVSNAVTTALPRAVAAELAGATFVFDEGGLARLVTKQQNTIAAKGPRR